VFHTVPHPANAGSGPSTRSHDHRLDGTGRQPHNGQRILANVVSSSRSNVVIEMSIGFRPSLSSNIAPLRTRRRV
jgi:hypothetical protein